MRIKYGFKTREEAERYADKNYYTDKCEIVETLNNGFKILVKED